MPWSTEARSANLAGTEASISSNIGHISSSRKDAFGVFRRNIDTGYTDIIFLSGSNLLVKALYRIVSVSDLLLFPLALQIEIG